MISLEEAYKKIDESVSALTPGQINTLEALGCVVAETVVSPISVPGFRSSAMDGIAVRLSNLTGSGPWRFPVQDTIPAGEHSLERLLPSHAVKIMTGAPLPEGADTVIPNEDIEFDSDSVMITKKPQEGKYVREVGDDLRKGEILIEEGEILDPVRIGMLASIGSNEVAAIPRPKIALLSTGTEIVDSASALKNGQIFNSNRVLLKALLLKDNLGEALVETSSPDDLDELCRIIGDCADNCDLVISTGGVSMGEYDLIPDAVLKLGGEILFHKISIKPGKPVLVARIRKSWFAGLPGNPVSAMFGYHLFVKRIIGQLMDQDFNPAAIRAKLADDIIIKSDRLFMIGVCLDKGGSELIARPVKRQQSGRLSSVKGIDGIVMFEAGDRTVERGTKVTVELL